MGVDEFRWLVHRSMQQHCAKQSKTEVRNHINALRQQTDAPPPAPGRLSVFSRPLGTAAPQPVGQGGQRCEILVAVDMGPLALAWASKRFPDECVTPPKPSLDQQKQEAKNTTDRAFSFLMDCGFDGPIAVFDMNLAANYFNSENATGGFRDPSVAAGPHGPVRYAVGDGRLEFYQICEWLYGELTSRGVRCVQAWTENADAKVAELVRDGFEGHKVACAYSTDCDVYVNSPKSLVGLHYKDGPKDQRTPVVCLFDRDQCLMDRGILPILPHAADKDAARDVLAVFAALGRLTSDRVKKRKSRLDATNPCVLYQMMRNPNDAGAACGANSKLELVEDYVLPALVQIRKCGPTPGPGGSSDILDILDHHMTSGTDFNNTFRAALLRGILGLSNKGRDGANAILERYERLTATERTELRAFRDWTRDNITML